MVKENHNDIFKTLHLIYLCDLFFIIYLHIDRTSNDLTLSDTHETIHTPSSQLYVLKGVVCLFLTPKTAAPGLADGDGGPGAPPPPVSGIDPVFKLPSWTVPPRMALWDRKLQRPLIRGEEFYGIGLRIAVTEAAWSKRGLVSAQRNVIEPSPVCSKESFGSFEGLCW